MHFRLLVLPGLLLAATVNSVGQTVPAAPATPVAATEASAPKLLLKAGLNAGRSLRWSGFYGPAARLPLSVGAEYAFSPKFTVYGQLDSDFRLSARNASYGDQAFVIPTGALGVGARYYYNQDGRARYNRAHGPFVGNYLALELHTELRQRFATNTEVAPGLNLVWGMQRRLGRNFLFDFNAGVGAGPLSSNTGFGYHSGEGINITTQFNLGVYFGR